MGEKTKIAWCDATWNPWRGCTKIAAGCVNCYAEADFDKRRHVAVWGPQGTRVVTEEANWRKPLAWNRAAEKAGVRRRVFCASLADVFEDHHALYAPREALVRLIRATPDLDWLLLTKRPENVTRLWLQATITSETLEAFDAGQSLDLPQSNVWTGTSVENQAAADLRIPELLKVPAVVRFLSIEPLLGPIDLHLNASERPDWVIVGGESGPRARPCNVAWIRSIVAQCRGAAIPVFVTQLGSRIIGQYYGDGPLGDAMSSHPYSVVSSAGHAIPADTRPPPGALIRGRLEDGKGGDPAEWPEDLRVREFPGLENR